MSNVLGAKRRRHRCNLDLPLDVEDLEAADGAVHVAHGLGGVHGDPGVREDAGHTEASRRVNLQGQVQQPISKLSKTRHTRAHTVSIFLMRSFEESDTCIIMGPGGAGTRPPARQKHAATTETDTSASAQLSPATGARQRSLQLEVRVEVAARQPGHGVARPGGPGRPRAGAGGALCQ